MRLLAGATANATWCKGADEVKWVVAILLLTIVEAVAFVITFTAGIAQLDADTRIVRCVAYSGIATMILAPVVFAVVVAYWIGKGHVR